MLLENLKKLAQRDAFSNVAVLLAVYGLQIIIFKDIFRCPCRDHKSYGLIFLFLPAILLCGLSLALSQQFWRVFAMLFKHRHYKARCNYFLSSLVDFFRPFLALVSWIVVVLLRGECFVCIRVGPGVECAPSTRKIFSIDHYYNQSFILGTACLLATVIFSTGIVCIQRHFTNGPERLATYDDLTKLKENAVITAFSAKTQELANEYAEKIVNGAFHDRPDSEIDVDERFCQAYEKVQAICWHKNGNNYVVDIQYDSLDIASSATM